VRANHVPAADRLARRIGRLQAKIRWGGYWVRRAGNPYGFCPGCGRTVVEVSVEGHRKGCPVRGVEREIAHYERLLADCGGPG
jgi:hypothetical protein